MQVLQLLVRIKFHLHQMMSNKVDVQKQFPYNICN